MSSKCNKKGGKICVGMAFKRFIFAFSSSTTKLSFASSLALLGASVVSFSSKVSLLRVDKILAIVEKFASLATMVIILVCLAYFYILNGSSLSPSRT